jgi:nucleoside-diphosphate-sugar epimerase/2-polyprenyl-3-methyl-5-hydroxy-6-metoxy-1,4-benzoquinol methylase/dTDP-4-dehydrorhamnose 3,5-epimerase-like enzyme
LKKIVITGGLGYIGMELAKIYSGKSNHYDITVIDKAFYSERVSQLKRWGIQFNQVDINNKIEIKKALTDSDIIYHLAGITDVATTIEDVNVQREKLVRKTGIEGTRNIIRFAPENSKIIFPSTHVIYEGLKKVITGIPETLKPKPVLEYAKGKYQSEQDLLSSEKDVVILRLGSVYGKSYDSTRLNIMPNLFSKITSSDGELKLYSGGDQIKSLVSVYDVARCFEYVGENINIKNQIYNCINENLTVKQVARLCKKVNKNLDVVITDDPVPNKGYSLSNKKIINEGFRFHYKLESSIKTMVESWKDRKKYKSNELIEIGADNFVDSRGIISNYYIDDSINMIGYVESTKNSIRGNHYHPVQTQKCLLIKGKFISITKDLMDPHSVIETRLINEGDLSTIPPHVAHTMVFLEDSIFLNLVNGEREHENYGTTHTIKYDLVDKSLANLLIKSYKTCCRVCGNNRLENYLSLGLSPLANNLLKNANSKSDMYPLELMYCHICSNSQLSVVVPPDEMFNNYLYLSSTAESFRKHFSDLALKLKKELSLKKSSLVVDIGSNDGIFLKPLKDLDINSIGVEPAENVAEIANKQKLKTLVGYFDEKICKKIIKNYGNADLVTAFNVFAHSDELKNIAVNASNLLKRNGTFIFEVQYIYDTIKDLTFDNIYHEHVNYWSVLSILHFFEDLNLNVYKIDNIDTHGGSIRVYCSKNPKIRLHKSVNKLLKKEKASGFDNIQMYKRFAEKVKKTKEASIEVLEEIKKNQKKIVGYGAPAKATTVLNYFGITTKYFDYVVDDNKLKQNLFIPGTGIKILNSNKINPEDIDYVLVLAWNFFETIKNQQEVYFHNSKFIKLK